MVSKRELSESNARLAHWARKSEHEADNAIQWVEEVEAAKKKLSADLDRVRKEKGDLQEQLEEVEWKLEFARKNERGDAEELREARKETSNILEALSVLAPALYQRYTVKKVIGERFDVEKFVADAKRVEEHVATGDVIDFLADTPW